MVDGADESSVGRSGDARATALPRQRTEEEGRMTHEFRQSESGPRITRIGDADYWHSQFAYALSGLSWAVGHLEATGAAKDNYAARVLERLNQPTMLITGAREALNGKKRGA